MSLRSSIIVLGNAYIEELRGLSGQELTGEESAALAVQIGAIVAAGSTMSPQAARMTDLGVLAQLLQPHWVEAIVVRGGSPLVARNVRKRQHRLFCECLERVASGSLESVRKSIRLTKAAGQWVWCADEYRRLVLARYYILKLRQAGLLYRIGARVSVSRTVLKLSSACHTLNCDNGIT